jgi:hypothetical protein
MQMSMICSEFRLSAKYVAILVVATLPTPALADALQQQVLAAARTVSEEDFAFTQTASNQRNGEPIKEFVIRYDPKMPKAVRWTLVKAEGRAPTAKESAEMAKRAGKGAVPSYARVAKWFGAPAERVATGPNSVTYRFKSLPAGTIKIGSHDASADAVTEAIVDTSGKIPFVTRAHIVITKPFRMMMVAKIEKLDIISNYKMLADGKPMIVSTASDMTGSMLGKSGWFKARSTFTDIRVAR